jgi:sugar phosphate isomerase/epimerase
MMANTDPAFVSFELDILWAFHGGADPAELLEDFGSRFKLMHVKDLRKGVAGDFTGRTSVENDVAVGTGQLNLPAIIKAARKSGIQHFYIEDESSSVQTQVPKSLAFLKGL